MFRHLLDLICPPHCPLCGESVDMGAQPSSFFRPFGWNPVPPCDACSAKLATPRNAFCRRCGGRRLSSQQEAEHCNHCRTAPFRFLRAIALGEYETELRRIVLQMKTDRSGLLATSLTVLLLREREEQLRESEADLILPVPIHYGRRWSRGVNSPDCLAEQLGKALRIPVKRHGLRRTRATDLQYMLSKQGRKQNVEGAFDLGRIDRRLLAGRRILLVDDILTTGATCNEISKILLREGARSVTVCVFARAEGTYIRPN